jgi:hypothetical protein
MTTADAIGDSIALGTAVIQLWTLRVMTRRNLGCRFPTFFFYTAFVAVTVPVKILVSWIFVWGRDSYTEFFYTAWVQEGVCVVLRFLMIREILKELLAGYPLLDKLGRNLVLASVVLSLAISVAIVIYAPGDSTSRIFTGLYTLDRTTVLVQSVIWIALFAAGSYFRLLWRTHVFGLALGFALFATQRLVNTTIQSYLGPSGVYSWRTHAINLSAEVSYLGAVLIWLWYLRQEESAPSAAKPLPAVGLEGWNSELERLLQR